jgi:hypothetical protein
LALYKKLKDQNKNSDDLEVPSGTSFSFNLYKKLKGQNKKPSEWG